MSTKHEKRYLNNIFPRTLPDRLQNIRTVPRTYDTDDVRVLTGRFYLFSQPTPIFYTGLRLREGGGCVRVTCVYKSQSRKFFVYGFVLLCTFCTWSLDGRSLFPVFDPPVSLELRPDWCSLPLSLFLTYLHRITDHVRFLQTTPTPLSLSPSALQEFGFNGEFPSGVEINLSRRSHWVDAGQ